jgi:putative Mn2+ efflux pump MntP
VDTLTILFIAVGLAMDAFAVSITCGVSMVKLRVRSALRIALAFGGFQALMPVMGYLAGLSIRAFMESVDHWIAFSLLVFIGCKMIYESFSMDADEKKRDADDALTLLGLSIATSIDALAVGFSLSLLKVDIIAPALIIGAVTFLISFAGTYIGTRVGHLFERKVEVLGGLILIGIGIKILIQHMC